MPHFTLDGSDCLGRDRILTEKTREIDHHCTMRIGVTPVENAVQDKADDDDPTIQTGNGTLKGMTSKEKVRLPHCLRYSAKVNFRDVQAWDLRLKDVLHWKSLFLKLTSLK